MRELAQRVATGELTERLAAAEDRGDKTETIMIIITIMNNDNSNSSSNNNEHDNRHANNISTNTIVIIYIVSIRIMQSQYMLIVMMILLSVITVIIQLIHIRGRQTGGSARVRWLGRKILALKEHDYRTCGQKDASVIHGLVKTKPYHKIS